MNLTTKDILKILPFDEAFKRDLLGRFDSLGPDEQYAVSRLLWDLYDAIYTMKLQAKIDQALDPDGNSQVPLNNDFYKTIKAEVEQEMTVESLRAIEAVDLKSTRDKLQHILGEPQS
jgi:hypothetical protein